jgi:ADP-ribose pyrophosphatase
MARSTERAFLFGGAGMNKQYDLIETQAAYDGFFHLARHRIRHSSFNGGWCDEIVRERIEQLSAVSVLLYDPDADMLVLVEQFRVGLMGQVSPPWSVETVSGFCDIAHESPEQVARREVFEETGCDLLALTHIGEFFVSPGMSVERINLYCGCVDSGMAEGIHGLEHEGEEMRVVKIDRRDAVQELFGRLNSTSVIMALQWLELHRATLLREWQPTDGQT